MKRLILALILFALFLTRFNFVLKTNQNLDSWAGREVKLTGKISSQIKLQDNYQSFNINQIKVYAPLYPAWQYGDEIEVFGKLQRKVINSRYSQFSLSYPQIKKLAPGHNFFIGLKTWLEKNLQQTLPEPESVLVAGILLGSQSGMSRDFWQALQQTGTLHIVVASGYNVSVVLGFVVGILVGVLSRRWAIALGIGAVSVYAFIAGLEPPVVRAALMGSLAYLAQALGRPAQALRLLGLTAGAMLLINPLTLFDVGFQLSFLATLGLITLCPRLARVPDGFREALAAQIFVWPVLLINFSNFNPFVILINGLIGWLVPIIMFFGAMAAATGWSFLGILAYVPAHLMVRIIYAFV